MAFGSQLRAPLSMQPSQFVVPVIQRLGKVCGRSRGFSASNPPIVEDQDGLAFGRQQICRSQARDARADDADIC